MLSTYASSVKGALPCVSRPIYRMSLMVMRCLKSAHGSSHSNVTAEPVPLSTSGSFRKSAFDDWLSKSYAYILLRVLNNTFCRLVRHADCHFHPRNLAHA